MQGKTRLVLRLAVASVLVVATGVMVGTPATARPTGRSADRINIGYTDSANPTAGINWPYEVDAPLGTWTDEANVVHRSRVYVTFDLTPFRNTNILYAGLKFKEVSAADCAKRAIEIWQVRGLDATPSWQRPPAGIVKLDEALTPEHCPAFLTSDVAAAVRGALAEGKRKLSIEIRVPAALEGDPSYGRRLDGGWSVSLNVTYNTPPTIKDRHMYNGGIPCTTTAPYPVMNWTAGYLQGVVFDPDQYDASSLTTEFAVWPENDPAARVIHIHDGSHSGRVGGVFAPETSLINGQGYAWQYRTSDGTDTSRWSKICHFVVDRTPPTAPTISSSNYPSSDTGQNTPLGTPGVFTFTGGGDADVVGFEWAWNWVGTPACEFGTGEYGQVVCPKLFSGPNELRANAPGGSASIRVSPPRVGYNNLVVRSLDAAGNRSAEVRYEFTAPSSEPQITLVGAEPEWNQPVTVKFSPYPGVGTTVSYTYSADGAAEQTVAAQADGTATITFTSSNVGGPQVTVRSKSANGWVSPAANWSRYYESWPGIQSDVYPDDNEPHGGVGIPGTFTFSPEPGATEVSGYRYTFNWVDFYEVPAGPDGKATITWTPEVNGEHYLSVYSLRPDGSQGTESNTHIFIVG